MSLPWSLIKEKYCNAYMNLLDEEELTESASSGGLYDPQTDAEYNIRNLYDYFDAKEIECFLLPGEGGYEKIPMIFNSYKGPSYEIRSEAESDLFSKAFELLEQKISSPAVHLNS